MRLAFAYFLCKFCEQNLLTFDDFSSANATADLRFVQSQTRYSADVVLNRRIVERIVRCGIAHVYLRAWQSLLTVNYIADATAFTNLQLVLSIIWNCTDKSVSLCDCLARAAVANHILTELADTQLLDADLTDDPDRHYLVKAYLGILHNMVRMCVDSRQVFRSAGAVAVLQQYLQRAQGLVRTKAYLILSYIVNEQENDLSMPRMRTLLTLFTLCKRRLTARTISLSCMHSGRRKSCVVSITWQSMTAISCGLEVSVPLISTSGCCEMAAMMSVV